jgi:hypothetical protein
VIWDWGWVWKSITVNNAQVGFRLYNDGNGQLPGSVTIVDSTFSGIGQHAIEMAVPVDVVDSGFTGLVLDNVNLEGGIKDHWSENQILAGGYYKSVSFSSFPFFGLLSLLLSGLTLSILVYHGCHVQRQRAHMDQRRHGLHA